MFTLSQQDYLDIAEIASQQGITEWKLMTRLVENCKKANSQALQCRGGFGS